MTREIVSNMGCTLIASDTDSVSYATNHRFSTAGQILQHVKDINDTLAKHFESNFMAVEIEEVILPQK
jgi:hypothetical protein